LTRLVHIATVPDMLPFFAGQVGYMKDRGFDVEVITSPGTDLDRFARSEGISAWGVPMTRRITPLRDLVALWRLWRRLRLTRPQIVHAHTPKGGLLGMISAWLVRVPVRIYHIHGLALMTATGIKGWLLRWTEKVACALAHHVLSDSHSVRGVAMAERLCAPEKIQVLLGGSVNGVDAARAFDPARVAADAGTRVRERYGIPPDATVAGFVGRLVRDKGIAELTEAWAQLREEFPLLHLLVVGIFEPQDPVPSEVKAILQSDSRIHLTGSVPEVAPFYAAMDLVVLPTYREGLPVVPLEAAAMELPVVATRIPGCVDAIRDSVTGTLVPVRDAAALANALRLYLRNPQLRRNHGRAGRQRVLSEFQQEAIWEALYQEYERLLRTKGLEGQDSAVTSLRSGVGNQRSG
jgi:glycosyltransferase involved in cell wall biosynthesis